MRRAVDYATKSRVSRRRLFSGIRIRILDCRTDPRDPGLLDFPVRSPASALASAEGEVGFQLRWQCRFCTGKVRLLYVLLHHCSRIVSSYLQSKREYKAAVLRSQNYG